MKCSNHPLRFYTKVVHFILTTYSKGMLGTVTGFNGINYTYTYDNFSRLQSKTESGIDSKSYTTSYKYDLLNRVTQETYPSGFAINKSYNGNGYLQYIQDGNYSPIWTCTGMNQLGQVTGATQGNNGTIRKTYDNLGFLTHIQVYEPTSGKVMDVDYNFDDATSNLASRINNITNPILTEAFTPYDNLDRLQNIKLNNNTDFNINYDNPSGNITSNSNVGTYAYAGNGAGPHAVTSIGNPSPNFPTNPQTISYTPFNKVNNISSTVLQNNLSLQFTYGPDYARKMSQLTNIASGPVRKVIYVGDYEEITVGSNTYGVHYISSPDGLVAMNIRQNNSDQLYYVHTDHLGSIISLYDKNGSLLYDQNFDAWGNERSNTDWSSPISNTHLRPDWLIRGFTGHEHHREFSLINMNGRLYDPLLGRMLSPDNNNQAVDFTQAYNRYSYCFNNPLRYSDPSGQNVFSIIEIASLVAVTVATGGATAGILIGVGALVGGEVGGTLASNGQLNPFKWNTKDWEAASIGATIGASVGAGFAAGFGVAGTGFSSTSAFASQGASSFGWSATSQALITADINMAASAIKGSSLNDINNSGAVGLGAGAIGGAVGFINNYGFDKISSSGFQLIKFSGNWSANAIIAQNLTISFLNGFGRTALTEYNRGERGGNLWGNALAGGISSSFVSFLGSQIDPGGFINNSQNFSGSSGRYLSSGLTTGINSLLFETFWDIK